jgi:putative hydrolase of the HAD superfamily
MLKAVIFDLGGVIVPFDFGPAYERMQAWSGLGREEIRARLTDQGLAASFERGELSPDQFRAELNSRLATSISQDQFVEMWTSIFTPGKTLVTEELIASLAARYRVLLLSNTTATHYEWLASRTPHFRHMHDFVLSFAVGAVKPQAEIYAEAIRRAQCAPGECFFTDDVMAYVEGARAAGIDAVQFTSEEQLRRDLAERGVTSSAG